MYPKHESITDRVPIAVVGNTDKITSKWSKVERSTCPNDLKMFFISTVSTVVSDILTIIAEIEYR